MCVHVRVKLFINALVNQRRLIVNDEIRRRWELDICDFTESGKCGLQDAHRLAAAQERRLQVELFHEMTKLSETIAGNCSAEGNGFEAYSPRFTEVITFFLRTLITPHMYTRTLTVSWSA